MLPAPFDKIGYTEVALTAAGLYLFKRLLFKKRSAPLPPGEQFPQLSPIIRYSCQSPCLGPKPLPLIGNALDMPSVEEWKTFTKWAQEYGEKLAF